MATLNEPSPQGIGSGSGPRCQDTTLGDAYAQTRFETASKQSRDPPLSEVNTSGSGEDSMEHQDDLTDFIPPTPHDSPFSGGHTPRSDEASTPIETNKALLKDKEAKDVDVHLYRSMIGSLMYLTTSRPDIMFVVCACARFQVTPKVSHFHAVKRIFRYLKGQPKLGLWYPRDSPFDLEAFSDSDYAGASLDRKSTTGGCQFLSKRLISWQCKKQAVVANSTTEAEYVAAANCCGQFWATAKSKTVNDVKQFHATVDGKTVVITESSVRSDLHFNDEDGTITPLFASMLVPPVVEGEDSGQPSKPQPPSLIAPPSHEEQKVGDEAIYTGEDDRVVRAATTATSLEAEQKSGNIHKTRSTATLNKPSSQENGSEVNTSGSREDSMEHQDDLTDFIPPTPHDSPLSGGHTPGSDEDLVIKKLRKKVKRLEKNQRARTPGMNLFKIGTFRRKSLDKENVSKQGRNLKTRFEEGDFYDDFDDIDDMVDKAMENVEGDTVNVGGAVNTATTGVSAASAPVTTDGVSISTAEPRTPPTTTTKAFEDEDLTIAQTLVKMRSKKAKEKGVAFRDVEESVRLTTILPTIDLKDKGKGIMQEPKKVPKNSRKAQIQIDEELAIRLHEEEKAELERTQRDRAAQEEASNAALTAQFDDVQARMDEEFRRNSKAVNKSSTKKVESSTKKAESSKKRARAESDEERVKKQKIENDVEKEELNTCLNIVPDEDRAVDYEILGTKYPIVNWQTQILGAANKEDIVVYQIKMADGSARYYKIFSAMLIDFDRQDVLDFYRLVKQRFETTSPEGYD
ncbi:hypothetical protein Tco_0695097 [Tanacetum coccineum]